jgi:hypothetical protein
MKPECFYKGSGFLSHTVAYQNIPILSDIFGQKPQVAGFQDVILGDEQIKALLADLKGFPQIEKLGNLWQNYMLAGIEHAVPGFGSILSGMTGTTEEELKQAGQLMQGIMPADVIAKTFSTGAMQNLLSGAGASPMAAANQARNFGLTSLDLMNQGANLLGNASQRWGQLSQFGAATTMPIQNMLITPQQQAQQTESNRLIQRQIQQERYNVAAAPNPIAKGLSDIVMYLTGQYLGALGGGKLGGGGGGLPQAGNAAATAGTSDWMSNILQGTGGGATGAPGAAGGANVAADPMAAFYGLSASPTDITSSSPINFNIGTGVTPGFGMTSTDPWAGTFTDPTMMGLGGSAWSGYTPPLYGTSDFAGTANPVTNYGF